MRWSPGDRSNIEDRRGSGGRGGVASVGIGGLLVLLVLSWATGTNFLSLLDTTGDSASSGPSSGPVQSTPQEERLVDFVGAVSTDTQGVWAQLLGNRYRQAKVVLFRDATQTACGLGETASGPFYCPGDEQVYLDLGFFQELSDKFGAPGEFAQAYVVAHEYGHHVQHLLGLDRQVGSDRSGANSASVALELQADCFAGVWGHEASKGGRFGRGGIELDPGDAEEALRAAASIGDDRLQKMTTGRVQPERFTHGTSAQRMDWFRRGLQSGEPGQCDTFKALTQ